MHAFIPHTLFTHVLSGRNSIVVMVRIINLLLKNRLHTYRFKTYVRKSDSA